MLADLFYLSAAWLVPAFVLTLLVGTRWRHSGLLLTIPYMAFIAGLGGVLAIAFVREPLVIVVLAGGAVWIAGVLFSLLLPDWNPAGQTLFFFSCVTTAIYLVYAFALTALSPLSPLPFLFAFFLFILETTALSLSLTYAFEVLDVLCRVRWHRLAPPKVLGNYVPRVSIHVPAYNEPPELVEQTLRALARLDYPNYEVILVDNNTPDETVWQPLAEICRELGFKCLHLEHWPGYKSGALNFALTMTDPGAEIIGVIDADYIVQPDYLRRLVPYFEDQHLAFVQTPQDYRDEKLNNFFQAAYDGYKYFFALSMPARNERNAIIFCGTMGLLRKSVLQEIGGWDEWCITEDAEASLRILNRGYESLYVPETFGRGLMPLDFEGLKKQRFRWAFGGVQVLKKHWARLMPWAKWVDPENRLTPAQRYFYFVSGFQWFNELLNFCFTVVVLVSVGLTLTGHTSFLRPTTAAFIILPIVLIGTNLTRAVWGLRHALKISWSRALAALTLWFALTWVVTLACIQALIQKRGVFLRTPKSQGQSALAHALQVTSLETTVGVISLLSGLLVLARVPSWRTLGLLVLCLSQAIIYLSAPLHSLASARATARAGAGEADRGQIRGSYASESRLGLQIGAAAALILVVVLVASLLPQRTKPPSWYAVYNPQPLLTPQARPIIKLPTEVPSATPTPKPDLTPTPARGTVPAGTSPTAGPSPTARSAASNTRAPGATSTRTAAPATAPVMTAVPTSTAPPVTATAAPTATRPHGKPTSVPSASPAASTPTPAPASTAAVGPTATP